MADLSVNIAGVEFKNPIIAASGTYGYGREYENLYPLSSLGGISVKGTTIQKRLGNVPPRIAEVKSGIINSVGLQNGGIDEFIDMQLPYLMKKDTVVIANIAGGTVEEYKMIAEKLEDTGVHMLEVNISCPNVKEGGLAFGATYKGAASVAKAVRNASTKPVCMKLSPNVTDIAEIALAVEAEGADAVSLINTVLAMKIDIDNMRPVLKNNVGGLSGSAVLPIAVRMVWQTANAVKIPIIGMGGVSCASDAIELMLVGASAVQIGTAIFGDPFAPVKVIDGINEYLDNKKIKSVSDIIKQVKAW